MNLHGLVRGVVQSVNPDIAATYLQSTGSYTTDAAGKRTPTYASSAVRIQVQAVSGRDIERLNGLGIQGVLRKVYDYGNQMGISRPDSKGGDLLQFPQTPGGAVQTWKVTSVAETWPDWSAVFVQLQVTP